MGYTIWDRSKGGPANRTRYWTHFKAVKACERMNAKAFAATGTNDRYYVKEL